MRAEYDRANNRVVALEMDDGRISSTHNPRVLGAETEWLPVVVVYPDGYDQRFNNLLSPHEVEYRFDNERIEVHYPKADFSPAAIRMTVESSISNAAKGLLSATDWYFVRQLDTGEPVPAEVSAERQRIRARVSELKAELSSVPDAEIASWRYTFDGDEPGRVGAQAERMVRGADGREWVTDAKAPGEQGRPIEPVAEQRQAPLRPTRVSTGLPWPLSEDGRSS